MWRWWLAILLIISKLNELHSLDLRLLRSNIVYDTELDSRLPERTNVNPVLPEMAPPEQVHLSLAHELNAMTITWSTPIPLIAAPYVEFGQSPESLIQNQTGNTTEWTYNHIRRLTHVVTLRNLEFNSIYYYQVGSNEQGWSHVFNFRTFPEGNDFPLRICVFGDLGYYNGTSTPYLQKAVQRRDFDIIIHVGDIAYDLHTDNGNRGDAFLRQIEPITAYVPYMVVAGNHEDDDANFTNYVNRFRMPNSPLHDNQYYSVDVGLVHLLAVSTEYHGFFFKYGISSVKAQDAWLRNDIERANVNRANVPWVLGYQHRPFYCSNVNSYECQAFENQLIQHGYEELPGLEELLADVVDLGFWGHEHSYERMWPVLERQVYNTSSNPYHNAPAPIYVVSGSAGCYSGHAWFPEQPAAMQPASAKRLNDYGYSLVHIFNATHIKMEQISTEKRGTVVDTMWITKDFGHRPSPKLARNEPSIPFPEFECHENVSKKFMSSCKKLEYKKYQAMIESIPP